jgi:uncharacterized protein YceK
MLVFGVPSEKTEPDMKTLIAGAALSMCAMFALTGCGTIANCCPDTPEGCLRPYGGVALDAHAIAWNCSGKAPSCSCLQTVVCLIDLPFSVVGDTILLPVAIGVTNCHDPEYFNKERENPSHSPTSPAPPKNCLFGW